MDFFLKTSTLVIVAYVCFAFLIWPFYKRKCIDGAKLSEASLQDKRTFYYLIHLLAAMVFLVFVVSALWVEKTSIDVKDIDDPEIKTTSTEAMSKAESKVDMDIMEQQLSMLLPNRKEEPVASGDLRNFGDTEKSDS